jgi:hypothetical protein
MWICISSIQTNKQTNKHSSLYIRLTGASGGFNQTFYANVCVLFVFLHDTLVVVAEATETCW